MPKLYTVSDNVYYTAGTDRQKKIATANVSEQFSSIRLIIHSCYHV